MTVDTNSLLKESTTRLQDLGWIASSDEANFPRFEKLMTDTAVSFCYQLIQHDAGGTLAFIAQVTSPKFCAAFGAVANTKFNDIGIAHKSFRVALQTPKVDDVVQLSHAIEGWGTRVDAAMEITALACRKSTKTHDNLKHFAALGLKGDAAQLETYLTIANQDLGRFGKAGPQQIEAALAIAASRS